MLKGVFFPNKTNSYAWANVFFLIVLVAIGKVDAYVVLFGYFLETLIIGLFNIVKMYYCYKYNDKTSNITFSIIFFIIHYGGFLAIQSIFVFAIFALGGSSFIKEPFHILENFQIVIRLDGMPIVIVGLFITQFVKFIFDFMRPKKYEKFKVNDIMFKPYLRIFIQQFTVIIGSFFIIFSSGSVLAAMLLILIRFIVDFFIVAINENSTILNYIVDKLYDGKVDKSEIRKQLLLLTE